MSEKFPLKAPDVKRMSEEQVAELFDEFQALKDELVAALEDLKADVDSLMVDFVGVTDNPADWGRCHKWDWLEEHGRLDSLPKADAALQRAREVG